MRKKKMTSRVGNWIRTKDNCRLAMIVEEGKNDYFLVNYNTKDNISVHLNEIVEVNGKPYPEKKSRDNNSDYLSAESEKDIK